MTRDFIHAIFKIGTVEICRGTRWDGGALKSCAIEYDLFVVAFVFTGEYSITKIDECFVDGG